MNMTRLEGKTVIASVSGGKDSAAMCLHLKEIGVPFQAVFIDTGWEHPSTYEFIRDVMPRFVGPVTTIGTPGGMLAVVKKKAMFPSRLRRFCTQEVKVKPMQEFLAALVDAGGEPINAVGIRAAESKARAEMTEWEFSEGFDCETWRPLIRWSEQDVIDIHKRHGMPPNPLYLQGASRVGCWPCIFARKGEIKFMARVDPGRVDLLRQLEADMTDGATARAEAKGKPAPAPYAWFQSRNAVIPPGGGAPTCLPMPIDDVVKWARDGNQEELFVDEQQGCMRWGLCDTTGESK